MKKLGLITAAVAAIAIAAPSVASAEKIVIKRGGEHHYGRADKVVIKSGHREGARAEFRGGYHDRGWHRGHDRKVVIIKHGRHRD